MEAGARETLFWFPRSESHSTATVREAASLASHDSGEIGRIFPHRLSHQRAVRANPPRPITLNARGPDQVLVFEMSQYVARATGMATKALDVAKTRVLPPAVEWYNATMAKNAQYVVKDPEAVDKLGKQLIFSNMAKLPAAVEAAQGEIKVVQQKWANRMELPMTEVRSRRPFAHRIRRARPASSFPRERCWQHRGTPTLTHLPLSLTAGWHRRPLLRGGVRVVLRRGNHRPRREPDRLLSAPPDRRETARKYLSDRTRARRRERATSPTP